MRGVRGTIGERKLSKLSKLSGARSRGLLIEPQIAWIAWIACAPLFYQILLTRSDAQRCGAAPLRPQGRLDFHFSPAPVIYIIPVASAALLLNFISSPRDH